MTGSVLAAAALCAAAALSAAGYFLPLIIAGLRRSPGLAAVAVINIALGWTVAGWVIALVMALRSARPAAPGTQVTQSLTAASPVPAGPPPLTLPPRPASPGPGSPGAGPGRQP